MGGQDRGLRAALVREIGASGAFDADPVWREAFAAVPRHLFVPYYYVGVVGGYERRWGGDPDPGARERWLRGAYEDTPLAIRLRDGELLSSSFLLALTVGALAPREAYDLWEREGRPQRERYGLTVDAEGDRAWLDDPGGPHAWPVPAA